MKDKIKLALAQISSKRENKERKFTENRRINFKAKEQGADLVIFPEMSLTGYVVQGPNLRVSGNYSWTNC